MRVLATIHHDLEPDAGAAGATLRLFRAVAEQGGHDVRVVGLEAVPRWLPRQLRLALFAPRVAVQLATASVDVVDASSGDAWVARLLRRRRRPLLVARSHGLEHVLRSAELRALAAEGRRPSAANRAFWRWRLWEVGRSFRHADVALFLNEQERDVAVAELGVPRDRTEVVDHGIAACFLDRPAPGPEPVPRVAFVGGLGGVKGGRTALEVLTRAMRDRADLEATMLGADDPDAVLLAVPTDLRSRVAVRGRYANHELPQLLAGHSLVLATPMAEGFGIALLEAMACGLAPVVFDVGGPGRIVRDGVDGRVVPPGDVAGAARAIVDLVGDPGTCLHLRRAAQVRARSFTWERAAEELVGIYRRRLAQRSAPELGSGRKGMG